VVVKVLGRASRASARDRAHGAAVDHGASSSRVVRADGRAA